MQKETLNMTTPEQIIDHIEQIEPLLQPRNQYGEADSAFMETIDALLAFKQKVIAYYNLPTADAEEEEKPI